MSNNILVIGNGYDLAHGLKTRYDDFIIFIKEKKYDKYIDNTHAVTIKNIVENEGNGFINYFLEYTNEVSGWVDMEELIKKIIDHFQRFFINYKNYMSGDDFVEDKMNLEFCGILKNFGLKNNERNYVSAGKCFKIKGHSAVYGLNKRKIVKRLRNELDSLVSALESYLMLELELNPIEEKLALRQIKQIDPKYVISFNYTTIYKLYGINEEDVFHVHGKLCCDPNNMVLGYNDDDPENLDFVYFKKYFQRIQKLTGYIDTNRFGGFDSEGTLRLPVIHFYGHSMDKTDGDIIQKLRSLASGFVIYKYNQEDYEQKVINLIDVFGKEKATRMIQAGWIKFVQCES